MKKTRLWGTRLCGIVKFSGLCLFFLAFLWTPRLLEAADPGLPAGSSPEVIEKQVREDALENLEEKIPEAAVEPPPQEPQKPGPETRLMVQKINLMPHPSLSPEDFETFVEPASFAEKIAHFEGREISFRELSELSGIIESSLRSKGLFAVVRLPPQEITEGVVRLEVLLARIGEVSVDGSRFFRKAKTRSRWRLPEGSILDYGKIREQVLAMNENPDRVVKPLLQAGSKPGTTDVVLKTEERFPLHASYNFDNQGAKLTGKERNGFMVRNNNMLSLDDIFLIGTVFGRDFGAIFLQHLIPINQKGTKISWGFSHAQVRPRKEFSNLGINGLAQTYSLGLRQRLKTSETLIANAYAGLDFKEKSTRSEGVTSVWDRLRVLSWGGDLQRKDARGFWFIGQDFYYGFSPHGNGYALTSRGAHTHFFKYGFSFGREQRLPYQTELGVRTQGQVSAQKLLPQEEMFVGGAGTVRGYPESDYGADQGILTNIEYRVPFFVLPKSWKIPGSKRSLREDIQILSFLDHAYGSLHAPLDTETRRRNLLGIGAGFQIRILQNLSARFEWGVPVGDDPLTESGPAQYHFRLTASV